MFKALAAFALLALATPLSGQPNRFVGGYAGISTLSADGRTDVTSANARFSSYKPENGLTVVGLAGLHINDFFSVMGSYGWNRNSILFAGGEAGAVSGAVTQRHRATMHTVIGEGMLYFRPRKSRVRPYLSAGAGVAHVTSSARGTPNGFGIAPALPRRITHTGPAFRVAVGIDLFFTANAAFRYSFSETLQGNPFSAALTPPAPRRLANFQNWFGVVLYF